MKPPDRGSLDSYSSETALRPGLRAIRSTGASQTALTAKGRGLALLSLLLSVASLCNAASITYYIDQTVGAGGVTGDIVTDGTLGVLGTANILEWNLSPSDGTLTGADFGPNALASQSVLGSDLSATATQLSFNFSGGDSGYLFLSYGGGSPVVTYVLKILITALAPASLPGRRWR